MQKPVVGAGRTGARRLATAGKLLLTLGLLAGTMSVAAIYGGSAGASNVYYVDVSGSGDACSQVTPCATISQAVTTAGSASATILVGAGTFTDDVNVYSGTYIVSGIPGQTTLDADPDGFDNYGATLTVTGFSIAGGTNAVFVDGGTTMLSGDVLTGNSVGILNNDGAVTVNNTTIENQSGDGAESEGSLSIRNSAVDDTGSNGVESYGTLTLENSTVTGNAADGVLADGSASTVSSDTLSDNGSYGLDNQQTVSVFGTIVAGNTGGSCSSDTNNDESGTPGGYNIDDGDSCGFQSYYGDQVNTDPLLGSLQDNGGPTQTQAILPTSPAYHQVPDSSCLATDQRGESRPQPSASSFCDVGAFEYSVPTSVAFTSAPITGPTSAGANLGPVTVQALDADGNPATDPDAIVLNLSSTNPGGTFSLTDGGSSTPAVVIPPGSTSGSFFTGAPHPGLLPVKVAAGSLGTISQTETVVTGPAATITTPAGDGQTAVVGQDFSTALAANVVDGTDNPVDGDTVTFTITGGPATFPGASSTATATTGVDGTATAPTLTAGTTPGAVTLTATVGGVATPATYGETVVVGPPASISDALGDNQTAVVTTPFGTPLVAIVEDTYGNPIEGAAVTFTVTAGSASFPGGSTDTDTTAADGSATAATLTAGTVSGPVTVTASVSPSLTTTFNDVVVTPGAANAIATTSGDSQSTPVTQAFGSPLVATVTDAYGNPVSGVQVTFTVNSGDASFPGGSTDTETTGADGTATAGTLTAGTTAGPVDITAAAVGVGPTTDFSETVVAGTPTTIIDTQGDSQQAAVTDPFGTALQATVEDTYGNPVDGASVTFTVGSGSASFPGGSTDTETTGADGTATAGTLTAGTAAGPLTVTASTSPSLSTPFSDLVVVAGPAASISTTSGGGQSATVTHDFGSPLVATVDDAYGNPVEGATVTFTVASGSASFSGGSTDTESTNVDGIATSATLTAGTVAGPVDLTASVGGVTNPASFAETVVAGAPATITTAAGNNQQTTPVTAFPTRLAAHVVDAYGNPVDGATVTFHVTSGPATFPGSASTVTATTGSDGTATAAALTAGTTVGTVTTTATVASLPSATFTDVVVVHGPPAIVSIVSGNNQTALYNQPFGAPLTVKVTDAQGNVISGNQVTFAVTGGSAVLGATSATTDTNGEATVSLTAGAYAGAVTVVATPTGVAGIALHATVQRAGGGGSIIASTPDGAGYWIASPTGQVSAFGDATFEGSTSGALNKPVVGITSTPTGKGYWLVASDGGIFAFGDATFYGSMGSSPLNKPIVGIASTPDGKGYWMVASDGGIFAFGDAAFHGSMGGQPLNKPIVGLAASPDGKGYWLVASDGGIFAFGDAAFYGSTGSTPLNQPIVGAAASPTGKGYWLVAADGGIFAFGDAGFFGSLGSTTLNQPIVGMAATPSGKGYWMVGGDGGVFALGNAGFYGSAAS